MSAIWLMHMNRVNLASGSEDGGYAAYTRQQFRLLPTEMQNWVMDQGDTFTEIRKVLKFKNSGIGTELGYEHDPLVWNDARTDLGLSSERGFTVKRLKDGSVDWSDPRIHSPTLIEREEIDYERFNLLILAAAEKAGLSWNIKMHTYDNGDVTEEMKNKKKQHQPPIRKTPTGRKYSDTPPGTNMNLISSIPGTAINIVDWHGTQVLQGTGYSSLFFDLVQARTNKENGTIIGVGGAPSDGKTYTGMRLGEIFNRVQPSRQFNPYIQIPFTQEHFLWLLSEDTPLTLGDVIVLDEAHFAAGARNWFKEDQKELVDLIASARNMGFIIILIVLHLDMLDKILRQFTMAFYLHMEEPGLATAYKTFTPRFGNEMIKVTIGPVTLQLPDISKCDHPRCLHCKYLRPKSKDTPTCLTIRGIYERRKKEFQLQRVEESRERRQEKNKLKITDTMLIEKLHEFHSELKLTSHGNIENSIIQHIIAREMDGLEIGKTKSREIAKKYTLQYPEATYNTNT